MKKIVILITMLLGMFVVGCGSSDSGVGGNSVGAVYSQEDQNYFTILADALEDEASSFATGTRRINSYQLEVEFYITSSYNPYGYNRGDILKYYFNKSSDVYILYGDLNGKRVELCRGYSVPGAISNFNPSMSKLNMNP